MLKLRYVSLGLGLLLLACESGNAPGAAPGTKPPAASAPAGARVESFGAPLAPAAEVALDELLTNPERYREQPITTTGDVQRACNRKGCWMELGRQGGPSCRVTFKDYGFFVPTDSAGAKARVQGQLVTEHVPTGRVRHLEAEGATFPRKNPDGSATEVTLVATGVELTR